MNMMEFIGFFFGALAYSLIISAICLSLGALIIHKKAEKHVLAITFMVLLSTTILGFLTEITDSRYMWNNIQFVVIAICGITLPMLIIYYMRGKQNDRN